MTTISVIGYIASILMIVSPLPQLYETWKTKSVSGLSVSMLITLFLGCILMSIYVIATAPSAPLLLNYGFSIVIVGLNIRLYFKYK